MQPTFGLPGNGDILPKQVELCRSSSTNFLLSRFSSSWSHLLQETVAFVRPALVITLVLILSCSTAFSLPAERPETGTYIRDMHRDGYGLLVIYNNWTMDTVAVLTDKKVKPKLAVYLRARDALEVNGIEDGEYGLYFTIGDGWNAGEGKFDKVYGYYRYNTPMLFETNDVGEEIEYTILELDLYKADATNFMPDQFQFPDISS
jgi:hypothetical protein